MPEDREDVKIAADKAWSGLLWESMPNAEDIFDLGFRYGAEYERKLKNNSDCHALLSRLLWEFDVPPMSIEVNSMETLLTIGKNTFEDCMLEGALFQAVSFYEKERVKS